MRILFVGCVKGSYSLLEELLINKKNICGVITKESNQFNSDFCDLSSLCLRNDIEYRYCGNINEPETVKFIQSKSPDIIYCFGWSQLLKSEIIHLPKFGVVGFHPAKLPYNKGRHPIIWALALGLSETASTFFMIDEKADNGDIISQYSLEIKISDDAEKLYNKIIVLAKKQVLEFTEQFENNTITYTRQSEEGANVWRKRTKEDGQIDFRMSAKSIYNLVRALTKPYVGAHFTHNGNNYKVWKCEIVEDIEMKYVNIEYGKVLDLYSATSFLVRCGEDLLRIINCDEICLEVGEYL